MSRLAAVCYRLYALLRPRAHAAELDEELRFHIEMDAMQREHEGAAAPVAHIGARRRLGNTTIITEQVREMSARQWLDDFLQDVRYAGRAFARNPLFALGAALTLALGIGPTAATFSLVDAVLLRALPYAHPERLIAVWTADPKSPNETFSSSPPDFRELAGGTRTISAMAAYYTTDMSFSDRGEPERLQGARVSASLFSLLGVGPQLGRAFAGDEGTWGRHRVAVLSDGLWRRQYGADPRVLGRTVAIDREPYVVVGVAPPTMQFPDPRVDLWVPMAFAPGAPQDTRGNYFLQIVARLRAGFSETDAHRELVAIARRVAAEHPDALLKDVIVRPLRADVVGDSGRPLLVLAAAIVLVLLIACANVAALVLARGATRRGEVALRTSLGASQSRVIRQLITESLLLGTVGALLAAIVSAGLVKVVVRHAPPELPRMQEVAVNLRMFLACAALGIGTALLFGLAPALKLSRTGAAEALRDQARSSPGQHRHRAYAILVAGQMALSLVLLVGAGLLLHSFSNLLRVDPGFRPERVLTMALTLSNDAYPSSEREALLADGVLERVRALPGVRSAAATSALSLTGGYWGKQFSVEGYPVPTSIDRVASVGYRVVTRDYFATMGIALHGGRAFAAEDQRDSPPIVIINEATARRFFPAENPLGKRIWLGPPEALLAGHLSSGFRFPRLTIVGVVADERFASLDQPPSPEVYQILDQVDERPPGLYLLVRTIGQPELLAAPVRAAVHGVDPLIPIDDFATMRERVERAAGPRLFTLTLLGGFSLLALGLAAVGLYGVIAYTVAERRREFAIRLALGATASELLALVMREAMRPVLLGVSVGILAALALAGLLRTLLFELPRTDPLAIGAAVTVLFASASLASALPAWRGTRVTLADTLRGE